MQTRKLLAALLVLGLLGLLVWKLEGQAPSDDTEDAATRFHPELNAQDVRSIRLGEPHKAVQLERRTVSGDDAALLGRIGIGEASPEGRSVWHIASNPPRLASTDLSEAAAEALVDMAWLSQIPGPEDLAPFGLGPGATEVEFNSSAGQSYRLRLGSESPLGGKRYVLMTSPTSSNNEGGKSKVSLVDGWALGALDRDPLSFRESRVFPFDVANVTQLRIERPESMALDLRREGRVWRFAEGDGLRAETDWVKEVLRGLAGLQAASFADIEGEFASPLWVQVTDEEGRVARLEAAPEGEGRVYQVRSTGALLPTAIDGSEALVEAAAMEILLAPNESVRALELLEFNPGTASRVEWHSRGNLWTLLKTQGHWALQAGESAAAEPVPTPAVTSFLESIDSVRAQAYSSPDLTEVEAGTEIARITVESEDGHNVGLRVFSDGLQDRVSVDDEPGLRDVSDATSKLLSTQRSFVEETSEEGESP